MKKYIKIFPYVFYALLLIFIFIYLGTIDYRRLVNIEFDWLFISFSILFALIARFWQVIVWFAILIGLGAKDILNNWNKLLFVFAKSWLGRYIPGTAPWIIGKIYFASKHGVSKHKLIVSSFLESIIQVIAMMLITLLILVFDQRLVFFDRWLLIVMTMIFLIIVQPRIFNQMISKIFYRFKSIKIEKEDEANTNTITRGLALYSIGAVFSGLSLFFLAKAVFPALDYSNVFFIIGINSFASASGMLAFFAPSGIGVRDGVQFFLLSQIIPTEIALLAVILLRLLEICMDLVFFGIASALRNQKLFNRHTLS